MPEISEMNLKEFLDFRVNYVTEEISELVLEMERVAHSPSELSFLAGRITELNYELLELKKYLAAIA